MVPTTNAPFNGTGTVTTATFSDVAVWRIDYAGIVVYEGPAVSNEVWFPAPPPEPETPTQAAIRKMLAAERSRFAVAEQRLLGTPPLPSRQWHRPRRRGRACGSTHRVMLG